MFNKDETLEILDDLLITLWEAAEVGAQSVQEYFDNKDAKIDPSLSHNLFRYNAKKYLENNSWRTPGLIIHNLPVNGLSMQYKGHHIRIWKDSGSELPNPGNSIIKLAFLKQIYIEIGPLFPGLEKEKPDNLVLTWDVDDDYNIKSLHLARPKEDPTWNDELKAVWHTFLEHPATRQLQQITQSNTDNNFDDLPYELASDDKEERTDGAIDKRESNKTS